VLQLLVSTRFHVLFHSPPGVLFTFPSRYLFTIGRQTVFSLTGWSRQIHTGFHVPRITWDTPEVQKFRLPDCHRLWCAFPDTSTNFIPSRDGVPQPLCDLRQKRFRLFPVHSPLLRESLFVLFSSGTKMFQFSFILRILVLWFRRIQLQENQEQRALSLFPPDSLVLRMLVLF
jgi:hypothetical protein